MNIDTTNSIYIGLDGTNGEVKVLAPKRKIVTDEELKRTAEAIYDCIEHGQYAKAVAILKGQDLQKPIEIVELVEYGS